MRGKLRVIPPLASSSTRQCMDTSLKEKHGYSYVVDDKDHHNLAIVLWKENNETKNNNDVFDTFYLSPPTKTHHSNNDSAAVAVHNDEEWTILDHVWTLTTTTTNLLPSSSLNQEKEVNCIWMLAVLWSHCHCNNNDMKRKIQLYPIHWNYSKETLQYLQNDGATSTVEVLGANGLEWINMNMNNNNNMSTASTVLPSMSLKLAVSCLHGGVKFYDCFLSKNYDNKNNIKKSTTTATISKDDDINSTTQNNFIFCELRRHSIPREEETLCPGHIIYAMACSSSIMSMDNNDNIETANNNKNNNKISISTNHSNSYYYYFAVATSLHIIIHRYEIISNYIGNNGATTTMNNDDYTLKNNNIVQLLSMNHLPVSIKKISIASRITQLSFYHTTDHHSNRIHDNDNNQHTDIYLAASSWDGCILLFKSILSDRNDHNRYHYQCFDNLNNNYTITKNKNNDNQQNCGAYNTNEWITVISPNMTSTMTLTSASLPTTSRKYPTYLTFLPYHNIDIAPKQDDDQGNLFSDFLYSFQLIHSSPTSKHHPLQYYQITYYNIFSSSLEQSLNHDNHHPILSISHFDNHHYYNYNNNNNETQNRCSTEYHQRINGLLSINTPLNLTEAQNAVPTKKYGNRTVISLHSNPTKICFNPIAVSQDSYSHNYQDTYNSASYCSWKRWYLKNNCFFQKNRSDVHCNNSDNCINDTYIRNRNVCDAYDNYHHCINAHLWLERRSYNDWYIIIHWNINYNEDSNYSKQSQQEQDLEQLPTSPALQITNVNFLPQDTITTLYHKPPREDNVWTLFPEAIVNHHHNHVNNNNDSTYNKESRHGHDDYLAIFVKPSYLYLYSRLYMGWKFYNFIVPHNVHLNGTGSEKNNRYGWIGCINDSKESNQFNSSKLVFVTLSDMNKRTTKYSIFIVWKMMNTNNIVDEEDDEKLVRYELCFDHFGEKGDHDNDFWKIEVLTELLENDSTNGRFGESKLETLRIHHHDGSHFYRWDIQQYSASQQLQCNSCNYCDLDSSQTTYCTLQSICFN